jgi:hypothetical protein
MQGIATPLKSGNIQTGNNTPLGTPKMYAVDNPYITVDDFCNSYTAQGLGISITDPLVVSGELQNIILEASAAINRLANMYFDTQTIDETKTGFKVRPYNPELVSVVFDNRPYSVVNSMFIQVLKWFIPIIVNQPGSYLQDFYEAGFCRIVPMLSTSGTGSGSPLPAQIVDHVQLGILWVNYTFGYGTPLTSQNIYQPTGNNDLVTFQSPVGNRLWAPSQPINVYKNGALLPSSGYSIDCPNGKIILTSAALITDVITADFTTNQSIPADIKKAVILMTAHLLGQDLQNPIGAQSYSIQTWSTSFGNKSKVEERVEKLIAPFANKTPKFI